MVAGVPCMCMNTYPAPAVATRGIISESPRPAVMSLTTVAPASRAAAATEASEVSTLTGTPASAARRKMTGTTRRRCSSAGTGGDPGRVDSPPTSRTAAPAAASSRPCSTARPGSRNRPPSENESGVTFTIPITAGSSIPRIARTLLVDECHRFRPGGGVGLEQTPDGRGDRQRSGLAHPPHRHAEVLGLDHHQDPLGAEDVVDRVGDLGREPLLDLGPSGVRVDQAGQFRQPGD